MPRTTFGPGLDYYPTNLAGRKVSFAGPYSRSSHDRTEGGMETLCRISGKSLGKKRVCEKIEVFARYDAESLSLVYPIGGERNRAGTKAGSF